MTANQWRHWFIHKRLHLHDLLVKCLEVSDTNEQQMTAVYEHDLSLFRLAQHAQKRIAMADLVSVLGVRCEANKDSYVQSQIRPQF